MAEKGKRKRMLPRPEDLGDGVAKRAGVELRGRRRRIDDAVDEAVTGNKRKPK